MWTPNDCFDTFLNYLIICPGGMQVKSPHCTMAPVNITPTFIKIAPTLINIAPINYCNEEINLIIKLSYAQ